VRGFSAGWLALREPADTRSRAAALEVGLAAAMAARAPPPGRPWIALDLASGTGSNVRHLAPRLPGPQHWRLLDADPRLLALARERCAGLQAADGSPVVVETRTLDLARGSLAGVCHGARLVTASALLDLVSETWLQDLSAACASAGAAALLALDYDGRRECLPGDAGDAQALAAFNQHQRQDKGFGPALGPRATEVAAGAFAARGFRVQGAPSDWRLGPEEAALQGSLLRGWAEAAIQVQPEARAAHGAWLARREAHLVTRGSRLQVGHQDLLALPPRWPG
jgi:SAM-dependent methyltransferase